MDWKEIDRLIDINEKLYQTMSLDGGLLEYSIDHERYNGSIPPEGRKVAFLNHNGHDHQLEEARKLFKPGQVLTVKEILVGGSSSKVQFMEMPGEKFNTVMFCDVD